MSEYLTGLIIGALLLGAYAGISIWLERRREYRRDMALYRE